MKKKKILIIALFILINILIATGGYFYNKSLNSHPSNLQTLNEQDLKTFTLDQLKKYNGNDDNLPVYLAYQGLVYDVSAGRKFYKKGGSYHYLAGKDSTTELNLVGGDIIKRKYPVIGKLK